jgi:TetR/AcrR family transcriptional regulator, lmrAB and yxaGH operons repressor
MLASMGWTMHNIPTGLHIQMISDVQSLSSRDRMIEAAIDLMRGYGLSGVGINDVVRESGAPRGSLYHFFPEGKLQIASEALAVQGERIASFMDKALSSKKAAPRKLLALFEAFARRVEESGFQRSCAIGAVTLDLSADAESLRLVLAGILEKWRGMIAGHFAMSSAREAESFAGLVLTAIEGAHIRARAERSSTPFREAGQWLSRLV